MYIPKMFQVEGGKEVKEFMQKNNFATVIVSEENVPYATHIPLLMEEKKEDIFFSGHVSIGNKLWKYIEKNKNALVIFQGPHSFVSSSWYEKENVSTWNYQAVHCYTEGRILTGEELEKQVSSLTQYYEKNMVNPRYYENLTDTFKQKELRGIMGFMLRVKDIQAAYKLSQNRNTTDYQNIINQLEKQTDQGSKGIAEEMKKRIPKTD
ncbi:MAG: FMN-binding negative transcriptional regulator [Chitinophagaceae bacterium]|nr:FMN-binding negative transcriptional regulator [Chitinophagaceae bacterium]